MWNLKEAYKGNENACTTCKWECVESAWGEPCYRCKHSHQVDCQKYYQDYYNAEFIEKEYGGRLISMGVYSLTAEQIKDFCTDALREGREPTYDEIEIAVGRYRTGTERREVDWFDRLREKKCKEASEE